MSKQQKQKPTGMQLILTNLKDAKVQIEELMQDYEMELNDLPKLEVEINSEEPEFDAVATLKQNPIAQKLESKIYNLARCYGWCGESYLKC